MEKRSGWTIQTIIYKKLSRGMLKQVTGRFGAESFRPGSFWPGSIRPWVVSAQFCVVSAYFSSPEPKSHR